MHLDTEMDFRPTSALKARFAPALYPVALFLSALLLFAVEPMFAKMVLPRIGGAAAVWSVAMVFFQAALLLGYATLVLLISAAALVVARAGKPSIGTAGPATVAAPTNAERTMWTVFAAIPAGLVIAVTAAISTDLAAAPFLWVLPLSLYLLSFVAIFRERAWVAHGRVLSLVPFAVVLLPLLLRTHFVALLAMHLVSFMVLA